MAAARARGARRRDARAGLPRAPRLAPGDGDARGAPRREPGPGRAAAAPAAPRRSCTRSRRRTTRAALETTAKLLAEDATDESTWAELERLARVANAEARLAEIYAAELEKVAVGRAGDGAAREAHGRALRGAEGRRPRAPVLPARVRVRSRGRRRDLRGDRPAAPRGGAPGATACSSTATRSTSSTTRRSACGALHTIALIEEAELHDDAGGDRDVPRGARGRRGRPARARGARRASTRAASAGAISPT